MVSRQFANNTYKNNSNNVISFHYKKPIKKELFFNSPPPPPPKKKKKNQKKLKIEKDQQAQKFINIDTQSCDVLKKQQFSKLIKIIGK